MLAFRAAAAASVLACAACSGTVAAPDPSAPAGPAEPAPEVQAILAKMRDRYRNARSYSDEGTFRDVSNPGESEKESITTGRFRTRWRAPDRLRFDVRIEHDSFFPPETLAVWTPRVGVTKSLFLGRVDEETSLSGRPLRSLQGVSHGLTGIVPLWLVEGGCRCASTYELRGTSACGSTTCFELVATLRQDDRVTLFVDTATGGLRKYFRSRLTPQPIAPEEFQFLPSAAHERFAARSLEPFDVEETIDIAPVFDVPVEESAFAYEPPSK